MNLRRYKAEVFSFFCSMKIILKWSVIFIIPSTLYLLFGFQNLMSVKKETQAIFLILHYLMAGGAIYFGLLELKKKAIEEPSGLKYIITGVLISVFHAILFGLISAFYFNEINPEAKEVYLREGWLPKVVNAHDSTAFTKAEYYQNLMAGKDSGVLVAERYEAYKKAANDSLVMIDNELQIISKQSFGYYASVIKSAGLAPFIGLLFAAIVTVLVLKKR